MHVPAQIFVPKDTTAEEWEWLWGWLCLNTDQDTEHDYLHEWVIDRLERTQNDEFDAVGIRLTFNDVYYGGMALKEYPSRVVYLKTIRENPDHDWRYTYISPYKNVMDTIQLARAHGSEFMVHLGVLLPTP